MNKHVQCLFKIISILTLVVLICLMGNEKAVQAVTTREQEEIDFLKSVTEELDPADFDGKSASDMMYAPDYQLMFDKAQEICKNLSTDGEKVKAIHDWIAINIAYDYPKYLGTEPYDYNPTSDNTPFSLRRGVCADYASIAKSMFSAVGIPCIDVSGHTHGEAHAWNLVWLDGKWQILDITWDSLNAYYGLDDSRNITGREPRYNYYLVSPEEFSKDHVSEKVSLTGMKPKSHIHNISGYTLEFTDVRSGETVKYSGDCGKPAVILFGQGREEVWDAVSNILPYVDDECYIFNFWDKWDNSTEQEVNKITLDYYEYYGMSSKLKGSCKASVICNGRKVSESRFYNQFREIEYKAFSVFGIELPEMGGYSWRSPLFCFIDRNGEIVKVIDSDYFNEFSEYYQDREKELLEVFSLVTDVKSWDDTYYNISDYTFEFKDIRNGEEVKYSGSNGKPALLLFGDARYEVLNALASLLPFVDKECDILLFWNTYDTEPETERYKRIMEEFEGVLDNNRILGTNTKNVTINGRNPSRSVELYYDLEKKALTKFRNEHPERDRNGGRYPTFCFVDRNGEIVAAIDSDCYDGFSDYDSNRDKELLKLFALITKVYDEPDPNEFDYTVKRGYGIYKVSKGEPYTAELIKFESDIKDGLMMSSEIYYGNHTYTVTKIGDKAFYKNKGLTHLWLPDKVTEIGKKAFYGCKDLYSVSLPKKLSKIGSQAFCNCKKLEHLQFNGTKLKSIGSKAFKGTMEKLSIPVPSAKYDKYRKMLLKAGVKKTANIFKY